MLQNGIFIDDISLPNIKAKQLYIKWNKKINIIVKELDIEQKNTKKNTKIDYKQITKYFNEVTLLDNIFEKILIEKISYNDINGSFKYINGDNGFLDLSSKKFNLKSSLFFEDKLLNIQIDSLDIKSKDIKINGNIVLNTNNNIELTSSLFVSMHSNINLNLFLHSNTKRLDYKIESKTNISSVKRIIDDFASNWEAKWWVRDAIDMSSLTIKNAYGYVKYDDIKNAYKNIYVDAIVNDLKYTYNEDLDVIDTTHTELEFKDGILFIRPKNAYTYDFALRDSCLDIDFSKKNATLSLYLKFTGQLNQDLLNLLNTYHIDLPFKQIKGTLDTDLKLVINLITTDVEAHGNFYTNNSLIKYLGLDINIYNANIELNNTKASVKNMFAIYEDVAHAYVDIDFDGKNSIGALDFKLTKVDIGGAKLLLDEKKQYLKAKYIISKTQDYLDIQKSSWIKQNKQIAIDKLKVPFDIKNLLASVPKTKVHIKNIASCFIDGNINIAKMKVALDVDLLNFNYYNIKLNQKDANLRLIYDNGFKISSKKTISLENLNKIFTIDNFNINLDSKTININNTSLKIDNNIDTIFSMNYNLDTAGGDINIHKIKIKDDKFGTLFNNLNNSTLNFIYKDNKLDIKSQEYNLKYTLKNNDWKLKLTSIYNLSKHSPLLSKYSLTNGSFDMHSDFKNNKIIFLLKSNYKYRFLTNKENHINRYKIDADINTINNEINLFINDNINIDIDEKNININMADIGVDFDEIIKILAIKLDKKETSLDKKIYLNSKNCYIRIGKEKYAISDTINLEYQNNILNAKLKYKNGNAKVKVIDNYFLLDGTNFNDEFTKQISNLSEFKGGKLDFDIKGTFTKYKGIINIKNTTMINYKILNNIFSFINTVPNLVTFSVPNYSIDGLELKKGSMNFSYYNNIYTIEKVDFNSKNLDIRGKGNASIKDNKIDLNLDLMTDVGSIMSKIPIVGYIIFDKKRVSTSLKISGKLNDPDVTTNVSIDILTAPLNILKRTLSYPINIFKNKDKK